MAGSDIASTGVMTRLDVLSQVKGTQWLRTGYTWLLPMPLRRPFDKHIGSTQWVDPMGVLRLYLAHDIPIVMAA